MLGVKILIYTFIFLLCSLIGMLLSKKYVNRVNELKEFKNALNIFKTKIKYTYEPLPDIFGDISSNTNTNISNVFRIAKSKMAKLSAQDAWNIALELDDLNINSEDKNVLTNLGNLLGKTDIAGQLNQIELTSDFLEVQIQKAEKERSRNEKLYKTLGMVIGLAIVIMLL